jgi:hypothetical protein
VADEQRKPVVIDDAHVGETYANKTIGSSFDGATITVTLGSTRVVPKRVDTPPSGEETLAVYVTARLALTPAAAVELVNTLNGMLSTLAKSQKGPTASDVAKVN